MDWFGVLREKKSMSLRLSKPKKNQYVGFFLLLRDTYGSFVTIIFTGWNGAALNKTIGVFSSDSCGLPVVGILSYCCKHQ